MDRIFILLMVAAPLIAQTTFDVASIKRNNSEDAPANSNVPLGPGDSYRPTGGHFTATNFRLAEYIAFAYQVTSGQWQPLLDQLPAWAKEDRYDIQARVEGNPGKNQLRAMMRALLADRCKLAIHEESRQIPVAALVLVKAGRLGPQIQAHLADAPCPLDASESDVTPDQRFPVLCGGFRPMPPRGSGNIRVGGRNLTLEFIADSLSVVSDSGRAIVDRTGLQGRFDFNLEWTRQRVSAAPEISAAPVGANFEEALKEQLGFKMESQKGKVAVLVLDHIEPPSGN